MSCFSAHNNLVLSLSTTTMTEATRSKTRMECIEEAIAKLASNQLHVTTKLDELIQRITVLETSQHHSPTPPSSSSVKAPLAHTPLPIPSPRPALMPQHPTPLPASLTSRGDTTRKLVAPFHPTLPLESGKNIHRGTRLPLNVLSVGNRVPQTILEKVLKDSASQTTNPEFHNVLHVVAQHHLVPLGSSLASFPRPPYLLPSPPPPPPKPRPPPRPQSARVCALWTMMFDRKGLGHVNRCS